VASQGLGQELRIAVKEVIRHDNVLSPAIIRRWGDIAACDPHPGDARIVKYNPEERKGLKLS